MSRRRGKHGGRKHNKKKSKGRRGRTRWGEEKDFRRKVTMKQDFDYFLILDLEMNQPVQKGAIMEIIQFACCIYSTKDDEVIKEFDQIVLPKITDDLSEFVQTKTSLTTQILEDRGRPLHEVMKNFSDLVFEVCDPDDYRVVFVTFGRDLEQINDEMNERQEECKKLPKLFTKRYTPSYLNLKKIVGREQYKGNTKTLKGVCKNLRLQFIGKAHDAIVDCRNTLRVIIWMMSESQYKFVENDLDPITWHGDEDSSDNEEDEGEIDEEEDEKLKK